MSIEKRADRVVAWLHTFPEAMANHLADNVEVDALEKLATAFCEGVLTGDVEWRNHLARTDLDGALRHLEADQLLPQEEKYAHAQHLRKYAEHAQRYDALIDAAVDEVLAASSHEKTAGLVAAPPEGNGNTPGRDDVGNDSFGESEFKTVSGRRRVWAPLNFGESIGDRTNESDTAPDRR